MDQDAVAKLVARFGADPLFSPEEAAFIKDAAPSERTRVQFAWRYGDLWVALWPLGYLDKLPRPEEICDVPTAVSFLKDRDTAAFIKDAKLRPLSELLDQTDLTYRYHWAATNARLKKEPAPARVNEEMVMERRYFLNWLIGYVNQEWDQISTDVTLRDINI